MVKRVSDPVKLRRFGVVVLFLCLLMVVYGCSSGHSITGIGTPGTGMGEGAGGADPSLGSGTGAGSGSGIGSGSSTGTGAGTGPGSGKDDGGSAGAGADAGGGSGRPGSGTDGGRDAGEHYDTGSEEWEGSGELPPGFPAEIPIPDNARIELAYLAEGRYGKEMHVEYLIPGRVPEHMATYETYAAGAGFQVTSLFLDDESDFKISRLKADRGDTGLTVVVNDIVGYDGTIVAAVTYTIGGSIVENLEFTWSFPPKDSGVSDWLAWLEGGGEGGEAPGPGSGAGGGAGSGAGTGPHPGAGFGSEQDEPPGGFVPVVGMQLPDDWGWPGDIPLPEPIDIMKARPEPSSKIQMGGKDDGTVIWSVIYRTPGEPAELYDLYREYVDRGLESNVYAVVESWEGDPDDPLSDWHIAAWTSDGREGGHHLSVWIHRDGDFESRVHVNYDESYKFWK